MNRVVRRVRAADARAGSAQRRVAQRLQAWRGALVRQPAWRLLAVGFALGAVTARLHPAVRAAWLLDTVVRSWRRVELGRRVLRAASRGAAAASGADPPQTRDGDRP